MGTLHIVNRPEALQSCLEVAGNADTVLLIEEAVSCALSQISALVVLSNDLEARGLMDQVSNDANLVDYSGFVDLVATHQPIVSWR